MKTIANMKAFRAELDAFLKELGEKHNVRAVRGAIKAVESDVSPAAFEFTVSGFQMVNKAPVYKGMAPEEKFAKSPWGKKHPNWLKRTVMYHHKKFTLVGATSFRPDANLLLDDGERQVVAKPTEVRLIPGKRDINSTVTNAMVHAATGQ